MPTGIVRGVEHMKGSGLATLVLLGDDDKVVRVHCDAGPLFRSLETSGANLGTLIDYTTGDLGLMAGFDIVGDDE